MVDLSTSVSNLPGVGDRTEAKLARLGIFTIRDLLYHWPRDWQDLTQPTRIAAIRQDERNVFVGTLHDVATESKRGKRRARVVATLRDDVGDELAVVWYNQTYLAQMIRPGARVVLVGTVRWNWATRSYMLVSPRFEKELAIIPVYPETDGVTSRFLRSLIHPLLAKLDLPDPLPGQEISLSEAVREMHEPTSLTRVRIAQKRLALDELTVLHYRIKETRRRQRGVAVPIHADPEKLQNFVRTLPFSLTDGQRRASWHLVQRLSDSTAMHQLLQGDVGSGKTVVALIAALAALEAGHHVAWMAPTQLLARQLSERLQRLLERTSHSVITVVGGERNDEVEQPTLFIGTQALLSHVRSGRAFALVIIDEQHRFGVRDRTELMMSRGNVSPHTLTMSATPIPRSLALTLFGELDCTTLSDRPVAQRPVKTLLAPDRERKKVAEIIRRAVTQSRQVFVVVPRIDASDGGPSLDNIMQMYQTYLPNVRFASYHGRQSDEEQEASMGAFLRGEVDVIVATTIVEVGLDVPNAAVMVIEEADRFGLAQLHQLRGRVGRGEHPGVCVVLTSTNDSTSVDRLKSFSALSDGFALAELDLQLRGPGELLGSEQSGMPRLQLASLLDQQLNEQALAYAAHWLTGKKPATLDSYIQLHVVDTA